MKNIILYPKLHPLKTVLFALLMTVAATTANAQNWFETQKIVASDKDFSDRFGNSVSISGNYTIVGAYREDEDTAGLNTLSSAGSAYIFERDILGDWTQVQKIVASDRTVSDLFGWSVSVSGNYAIVGAFYEDEDAAGGNTLTQAGSAYIFERDSIGNWNQVQKIVASDRAGSDLFGSSVSISGNYAIVGAYLEDHDTSGSNYKLNAGSAYIFERDSIGNWNQVQKIVTSDRAAGDEFGWSVSISGTYAIVGAYQEDEDTTGGNMQTNAGSAYIFERDSIGNWNQMQKIIASDRNSNDLFGWSVSISGTHTIVGAYQEDEDTAGLDSLADAGSAYIFERDSLGNWNQAQKIVASDRATDDYFGYSMSISGNYAIVGALKNNIFSFFNAGAAYIFERDSSGYWNQIQKITASDKDGLDEFSNSVSISGNYVIIGATLEQSSTGSAYMIKNLLYPNQINGRVYKDANGNCLIDTGDIGLQGILVKASPYSFFGITDSTGKYTIYTDYGTYQINQVIPDNKGLIISQNCPSSPVYHTVVFDSLLQDTSGLDFSNNMIACAWLTVDISSWRRRRCFRNYTTIRYCNEGFADTTGVKVFVAFPQYVNFISADRAFTVDSMGNYVFNVDTLRAGECSVIHIIDSVSCVNGITGLTQCTKAWITPANSCVQSLDTTIAGWDKSSVAVEGACVRDSIVQFIIYNTGDPGTGDMTGSSEYRIYADAQLIHTGTFQLNGRDSLVLQILANGQTIRLEADQLPGHPGNSHPNDVVEACGTDSTGSFSTGFVNQQPTDDEDVAMEEECLPIRDSYDPNDKQVSPEGLTASNFVKPGTLLDYVIRFQNTGTDTAYKVVVVDTLPEQMDVSKIQFGLSSHAYELNVSGKGRAVFSFTFNNINLPDSAADVLNSQGYLKFKIAPYDTLPVGTIISNNAAIYFDFNLPVITNDAWVTIHDTTFTGTPKTVILCDTTVPPLITLNMNDTTICQGEQVQLQVNGGSGYYWYGGDSINDPGIANPVVNPTQSETYWVEVASDISCYTSKDSVQVNVNALPNVSAIASDTNLCEGDSAIIYGSGAVVYAWDNGVNDGDTIIPAITTTYHVTGTDSNGCENTDSVEVIVNILPTVNIIGDSIACDSTILDEGFGIPGDTYLWSTGDTTQTITVNTSGNYSLVVTVVNGCQGSDSINVTVNPSYSINTPDDTICIGDSVMIFGIYRTSTGTYYDSLTGINNCDSIIAATLTVNSVDTSVTVNGTTLTAGSGGASYGWVDCNNGYALISGATGQSYTATTNGNYAVIVTANGCSDTSSCRNIIIIGIAENDFGGNLRFYPNPAGDYITLDLGKTYRDVTLNVKDITGKIVYTVKHNKRQTIQIYINNLPDGVYIIQLNTQHKSAVLKFVKQE